MAGTYQEVDSEAMEVAIDTQTIEASEITVIKTIGVMVAISKW